MRKHTFVGIESQEKLLNKLKVRFQELYESSFDKILVYGSYARGEATNNSDVDLLTVLKDEINPYKEIDRTGEIIAQYSLENNVVISCHFISSEKFHQQNTPFLANVKREGIVI